MRLAQDQERRDAPGVAEGLRLPGEHATFGTVGDINLIGLWTLYRKEVRRFFKVVAQTVMAPVITTLVFLAIFALALGRAGRTVGELPFLEFLAPGLVIMALVQNSFANTSSSIMIAKVQGNIIDYLMPPLSPGELLFGLVMGGVTRGVVVGGAVYVGMWFFVEMPLVHPLVALYTALAASVMLSLLGVLGALWAEKFDHMATVTNFVITPLSFLSGTFYSVRDLPEPFHMVALGNPFFYMIDGFRYGVTGHHDGSVIIGAVVLALVNLALWTFALHLLRLGYKLKA
ncbi:ABC transporter permease [Geminicoccaceae bacterium 1502E]|nr:ABC transporter permease [Geminicoccaceae bacterium 1502E]